MKDLKIYESPDKGDTVYSREFGSNVKHLHSESEKIKSVRDMVLEDEMWAEVRQLAKTNATMKDAVDRVIMLYHLLKDRK